MNERTNEWVLRAGCNNFNPTLLPCDSNDNDDDDDIAIWEYENKLVLQVFSSIFFFFFDFSPSLYYIIIVVVIIYGTWLNVFDFFLLSLSLLNRDYFQGFFFFFIFYCLLRDNILNKMEQLTGISMFYYIKLRKEFFIENAKNALPLTWDIQFRLKICIKSVH